MASPARHDACRGLAQPYLTRHGMPHPWQFHGWAAANSLWHVRRGMFIGHNEIWQRRFYDFLVFTEKKRVEKLLHMHRNPAQRGLVLKPEEWLWSSFRHYAYANPVRF